MEKTEHGSIRKNLFERLTGRRRSLFALRMAPMIDMVFLLLIFFLVAAKWRPAEDFLPIKLPTGPAEDHRLGKPEPLTICISATAAGCAVRIGQFRTVRINNENIEPDLAALIQTLHKCLTAQRRFASDPIEIVCEPAVRWEHLARIYSVFCGAGLTDITFRMTE